MFNLPGAVRQKERRQRWIGSHFVGENGPTEEDPDPISAVASKERVS